MTKEENEREYRVINQCLSMHAMLAQQYLRRERVLNITLLLVSAVLCAFTFADEPVLRVLGASPTHAKVALGVLSAVIFGLSIVEFKVNWLGISEAHADAARRLAALKMKYRQVHATLETDKTRLWSELSREYAETSMGLRPIHERQFVRLKARHATKMSFSNMVDRNPGVPLILLAVAFRVFACWRFLFHNNSPDDN